MSLDRDFSARRWRPPMPDPSVTAGLMLASGAMGAVGSISAGNAAADAREYNAAIERNNARAARDVAGANAERADYESARVLGAQRTAFAAAGVDVSSGTPLDVMGDSATQAKLKALSIIYGGEAQAAGFSNQATADLAAADSSREAGLFGAGTSLLSGAAKAAPYMKFG